jgi:hypothetical protein
MGKDWLRFKARVEELKGDVEQSIDHEPHDWQLEAAVKVLGGNDGVCPGRAG